MAGKAAGPAEFTLCPARHNRTCSIGDLATEQAILVGVTSKVGAKATVGEQITLVVNVQGAGLSPAAASITALVGAPSSSSPGSSSSPAPTSQPFPLVMPGPTVNPSNLTTLFPVVTPSATPLPTAKKGKVAVATQTASSLPLDPRLIGGQLAGLAGLAAALTLVVARLSLRPASPTAPAAPPGPAPSAPAPASEVDPPAEVPADEG